MIRHLAALAVVAGCADGLVIEAYAPAGTARVELFLAQEACGNCSTLAPPDHPQPLRGDIWYRDGASLARPVESDGAARFEFQASDAGTGFARVLAVGFDAAGEATSTAIVREPLDAVGAAHVVIELAALAASGELVEIWRTPDLTDTCAMHAAPYNGGAEYARTFVVPADNPDCDVPPANATGDDCDEYSHASNETVPPLEAASCFPFRADDAPCFIGGPDRCTSDDPTACASTRWCAPDAACGACADVPHDDVLGCIANAEVPVLVACQLPLLQDTVEGQLETCNEDTRRVAIAPRPCVDVEIALPGRAPVEFGAEVRIDDGESHELQILAKAVPAAAECVVEISIRGSLGPLTSPPALLLRAHGSAAETFGYVMPLRFEPMIVNDVMTCQIWDCEAAKPPGPDSCL